jgi:CDP-paratose synthetase
MATLLITGATGYLGSRIVLDALSQGHAVRILARAGSDPWRLAKVLPQLRRFNLQGPDDAFTMGQALSGMGEADAVVHCATAYGRKGESEAEIFATNCDFPVCLLTAAAQVGVGHFVNTDTVLPATAGPYATAKVACRLEAQAQAQTGRVKVTNLALEHFFGPGDDITKFPVWVTRTCLTTGAELNLTNGTQLRDFIFIDDLVAAYRTVLSRPKSTRWAAWRVGSGAPVSIRTFVETIHKLSGSDARLNFGAVPSRAEPPHDACFADLAQAGLGWAPQCSLIDGLRALVASERKALASP